MRLLWLVLPGLFALSDCIAGANVPARPAAAASQPAGTGSPAVRAAAGAEVPGELRPVQQVVPQIAIPLRSRRVEDDKRATAGAPAARGIDDAAANCAARKTKRERLECKRRLQAPQATPAKP